MKTSINLGRSDPMLKKTVAPRISEMNAARHIGHHVIPIWFEVGFIEIIKMFNPDLNGEPCLVMVNLNADFINEMYLGTDVEITTGVKKIGNSSFVLQHQIHQGERLCAKGTVTFIHFDYAEKKKKPIPRDVRIELEKHLIEE
jgi:acyl-CoA thioester hydrolase